MRRLAVLLVATLVLAGCGGDEGTATLWVTTERGSRVLLTTSVPAGLTAMQALERKAEVDTTYGGRFVVAINGIRSRDRHDWFYYLNGVALGRSAAEYRLHDGDVEWWDYTEWRAPNEAPAVVGAFPEPFVHGIGGDVPPAVVLGKGRIARALARLVRGKVAKEVPAGANVLEVRAGNGFRALTPKQFVIGPALADRLVRNPRAFRFRYAVP